MSKNKPSGATVSLPVFIYLEYRNTECGRTMFRSPNLEGFSFLLEAGETPETMEPTLREFLRLVLNTEISARWAPAAAHEGPHPVGDGFTPFKNLFLVLATAHADHQTA